jgi:hypothetical protein
MKLEYQALILAAVAWPGLGQPRPAITLRVVNEAGVEERILKPAEREATAILGRAEIDVQWLQCESGQAVWGSINPCQTSRGPAEFWLRIAAKRPKATTGDMLAFTELDAGTGDGLAGVYYPAVVEVATADRPEVAAILGATIVHEVGHLILGANAHSAHGVMNGHWGREQFQQIAIDEIGFSAEQARKMRDALAKRGGEVVGTAHR